MLLRCPDFDEAKRAGLNVVTFDTFVDNRSRRKSGEMERSQFARQPHRAEPRTRVEGFKPAMNEYSNIQIGFGQPDNDDLRQSSP